MNTKPRNTSSYISFLSSLAVHVFLITLFGIIYFENSSEDNSNTVELDYERIEKVITKEEKKEKDVKNQTKVVTNKNKKVVKNSEVIETVKNELNNISTDTTKSFESEVQSPKMNLLDSMIVNNPSIISLKYALSNQIKSQSITETDSAFIVRRLKESVLDYYKMKYPTPLSKFGERNSGIAIDKIIDLFKSGDDIDEKKIKEYLNIK